MSQVSPKHIAVIPDGNARWAKSQGLTRFEGYQQGANRLRDLIDCLASYSVDALTVFVFSSENQGRSSVEVRYIEQLMVKMLRDHLRSLHDHGVKVFFFGALDALAAKTRSGVEDAMALTEHNTGLQLNFGLHYSGRWHVAGLAKHIASSVARGDLDPASVDADYVAQWMRASSWSEPDLLIRTGFEQRVSNFMLWHLAYTELYFPACYWPDFSQQHLDEALLAFAKRQRRYGLHVAAEEDKEWVNDGT
jgi:undecaprenyl diphosphate synthase